MSFEREALQQGIAQGITQGITQGREEARPGLLDAIALALELRYGAEHPLLPRVLEDLQAIASLEHLTAVQRAIRTTPTLEELRARIQAESQEP